MKKKTMTKSFKIFLCLICFLLSSKIFAQVPSVIEKIRIPIWAELDAYPESEEAQDLSKGQFDYPIRQLKKTAPFLFSGMVYGWNFVYVPSDKARGVEEYFEVTEVASFEPLIPMIKYVSPWEEQGRLYVWCEYVRTQAQIQNYYLWSSIQNPVIHGRGYGNVSDGFNGFTDAAKDALKNAVREHYRKTIKDKPKEITGSVLIRNEPTIGIDAGRYTVNLDFYLESGRIIKYTTY